MAGSKKKVSANQNETVMLDRKDEGHAEPELIEGDDAMKQARFRIAKVDDELQLIYGIVLEPYTYDTQGDVISEEETMHSAHKYLMNSRLIGLQHKKKAPAVPVESFTAPTDYMLGGQHVKRGSWVMAVKVLDDTLWHDVKAGKYTGFSAGGFGERIEERPVIDFVSDVG